MVDIDLALLHLSYAAVDEVPDAVFVMVAAAIMKSLIGDDSPSYSDVSVFKSCFYCSYMSILIVLAS